MKHDRVDAEPFGAIELVDHGLDRLAMKLGLVVARLIRYEACVSTGRTCACSAKVCDVSSVIVLPLPLISSSSRRARSRTR